MRGGCVGLLSLESLTKEPQGLSGYALNKESDVMIKKVLILAGLFAVNTCFASSYVVWGTEISIYAQSRVESGAHMIQASNGIYNNGDHPWCGRRVYIELDDNELFSAALAAAMSQQKINFIYEDAAPNKLIAGHTENRCKVISIFQ